MARRAAGMAPVRLRTLGPIELVCADRATAARIVGQPKRLAVLAFLAARPAGERVSRDRILATFWPELPAARAQGALRNTLYYLRGALGGEAVVGRGGAVGVSAERVACDAAELLGDPSGKSASSLLDLYRGEFLDGLHIGGSPDFERWVDRMRAALRSRATELAWSLSKEAESLGEWITAARYARRAADLAVDVEGATQRLIRLLDRAGDRAAALAEYERLGSWLESEFGVSPSPETASLVEGVRARSATRPAASSSGESDAITAHRASRSLAVLPFDDLTGDAGVLAAGLAEDLITALATLRGARVVSRTSVMRFASERPRSMRDVRDVLGVDLVLEGTVRVAGGRVRVTAQLIDAGRDEHVWAETYDRSLTDVFEVQSDIALRIARALDVELSPRQHRRLRHGPTRDLEAYQFYLKGREVWSHRKPGDAGRAIDLFRRALDLDPDFALAWVGVADVHLVRALLGEEGVAGPAREARIAIDRALEADPSSGEASATLGLMLGFIDWDLEGGGRAASRAVELSPGYATAHQWRGQWLTAVSRHEEGLAELDIALELDLLSPAVNDGKALGLYHAGRIDEAIAMFERTLELDGGYWRAMLGLSYCHASRGDIPEAVRVLVRAWAAGAAGGSAAEAAEAGAKLDRGVRPALEHLLEAVRPRAASTAMTRCVEVQLLMLLGRHEDALASLEAARAERSIGFTDIFAPALDPLAGDVRFRTLKEESSGLLPRWRRAR